tara:strand:- start:3414 stop:4481 length:1068 start_codon:yes stop_codon:yes gene_type:complete
MSIPSVVFITIFVSFVCICAIVLILKDRIEKWLDKMFEKSTEEQKSIRELDVKSIISTIEPFKIQVKDLQEQIIKLRQGQSENKESFRQEVSKVIDQTNKIGADAKNLTTALKGDSKTQGAWGEMILEKTLEESGLRKGQDYELQKSFRDDQENLLIPDAIIYLPGDRNIIIDSKVSLKAYTTYINTDDPDIKVKAEKDHVKSLKDHMKGLGDKGYKNIDEINSPDYVLIFVPLESALSLALNSDWDIQRIAAQRQMGFVTPTNLIAILRMAESLWKLDAQNENAAKIAQRAGLLIDKFSGLDKDLSNIGKYLKQANNAFEAADNKLTSGKGNLFDQIKELENLGAKSKKLISKK